MRLSILDQSPIPAGATAADALGNTTDLARRADALGFHRYWVSEHHGSDALAGTAPEVLIAHLAAATERIRVGSGGVMLPHYRPMKVAEQFRVLHTLHPGRIDLGVGRAPGTDPRTASALGQQAERLDTFPDDVVDLIAWVHDRHGEGSRWQGVVAGPRGPGGPVPWMLGSSAYGAALAARLGMPYCFAGFISPDAGPAALASYRERFEPVLLPEPTGMVCVSVLAADTDAEAERAATSLQVWRRWLRQGRPGPFPSVEDAEAMLHAWGVEPWSAEGSELGVPGPDSPGPGLRIGRGGAGRSIVLGSADRVAEGVRATAEAHGVDEVMVVTITHDHAARVRSYELLADRLLARRARVDASGSDAPAARRSLP